MIRERPVQRYSEVVGLGAEGQGSNVNGSRNVVDTGQIFAFFTLFDNIRKCVLSRVFLTETFRSFVDNSLETSVIFSFSDIFYD